MKSLRNLKAEHLLTESETSTPYVIIRIRNSSIKRLDNFVGLHFTEHSNRTFATAIKQICNKTLFVRVANLLLNLEHSQIQLS